MDIKKVLIINIFALLAFNAYEELQGFLEINTRERQAVFRHVTEQQQLCTLCKDNKPSLCLDCYEENSVSKFDLFLFAAAGLALGYMIGRAEVENIFFKKM